MAPWVMCISCTTCSNVVRERLAYEYILPTHIACWVVISIPCLSNMRFGLFSIQFQISTVTNVKWLLFTHHNCKCHLQHLTYAGPHPTLTWPLEPLPSWHQQDGRVAAACMESNSLLGFWERTVCFSHSLSLGIKTSQTSSCPETLSAQMARFHIIISYITAVAQEWGCVDVSYANIPGVHDIDLFLSTLQVVPMNAK